MLDRVLAYTRGSGRPETTAAMIWKSIRHPDFQRKIVDFLWKILHNAHRVGSYWNKIPGLEARSQCTECGVEDTMEHILFHCRAYGRRAVWVHAQLLWEKKGLQWKPVCLESLVSAGIPEQEMTGSQIRPAHTRLWRLLVTESAHLIWRLRCERVIGHEGDDGWHHTEKAVTTQWLRAINNRLRQDVTRANPRFGRLALKSELVKETWGDLIPPPDYTNKRWIERIDRVLVGIDPKIVAAAPD